jgi:uncharacterized damage-inducible protein DinB
VTAVEQLCALARNNAWSNYRLHGAGAQLSEHEYRAERVSFFPSLPPFSPGVGA